MYDRTNIHTDESVKRALIDGYQVGYYIYDRPNQNVEFSMVGICLHATGENIYFEEKDEEKDEMKQIKRIHLIGDLDVSDIITWGLSNNVHITSGDYDGTANPDPSDTIVLPADEPGYRTLRDMLTMHGHRVGVAVFNDEHKFIGFKYDESKSPVMFLEDKVEIATDKINIQSNVTITIDTYAPSDEEEAYVSSLKEAGQWAYRWLTNEIIALTQKHRNFPIDSDESVCTVKEDITVTFNYAKKPDAGGATINSKRY
jgi:hypothetical protein